MSISKKFHDLATGFANKAIFKTLSLSPFPYPFGMKFAKKYNELMESQWYTKELLGEIQIRKLEAIIKHAYENVPYYRRVFNERGLKPRDIQNFDDLKKLPILTKEDVREHLNDLKAMNFECYHPILSHTSGSTGTAMDFYLTKYIETVIEPVHVWRHWNWSKFHYRDRAVIIRGRVITQDLHAIAPYKQSSNNLLLSSYHLSEKNLGIYSKM
ncbi:MAG: hypothetical protein QG588_1984, partial [Candidatus Poribacteria bacterium]|nr:hypothetical protein [Candidatus Poribacteria bacterium]